jgi:hypothetical protein
VPRATHLARTGEENSSITLKPEPRILEALRPSLKRSSSDLLSRLVRF